MRFLLNVVVAGVMLAGFAGVTSARTDIGSLRYLSYAIRDTGLTPDEARAFFAGTQSLEQFRDGWLASPEHEVRIMRYFNDMFGVRASLKPVDTPFLLVFKQGVYSTDDVGWCSASQATSVQAWWSGENVLVCPGLSGTPDPARGRDRCWDKGGCGCGPQLAYCIAEDLAPVVLDAVRQESAQRGLHAYETGQAWRDFLASDKFYGNRYLYWYYLATQKMWTEAMTPPSADDLAVLTGLPLDSPQERPFPPVTGGEARSGVVTTPGFLMEFNNPRSRIRWLTQTLLCKDIDPTLNTDDFTQFVNPDISDADKEHGIKPGCAGCHFPMDNMGSATYGWGATGIYDTKKAPSQAAHAFGLDGEGAQFLITSITDRGPGFGTCMAQRAWESFSGLAWASLPADAQSAFVESSKAGPKDLISSILKSTQLLAARSGGGGQPNIAAPTGTGSFADIKPILDAGCGGTACHSKGGAQVGLIEDEKTFRTLADVVAARVASTGAGKMPPPGSGRVLSADDVAKIRAFLGK